MEQEDPMSGSWAPRFPFVRHSNIDPLVFTLWAFPEPLAHTVILGNIRMHNVRLHRPYLRITPAHELLACSSFGIRPHSDRTINHH